MKKFLIITAVVLTGCATSVPVVPPFPDVPESLMKTCPDLKPVDSETIKLSDVLSAVADNYHQYYDCKSQVDDWIEWYKTQKGIFNKIK
jgi:hypothetical protein